MPIGHITNGVHVRTWLAPAMQELYSRHSAPTGSSTCTEPEMWARHRQGLRRRAVGDPPDAQGRAWCTSSGASVADQRRRDGYGDDLVAAAETRSIPTR